MRTVLVGTGAAILVATAAAAPVPDGAEKLPPPTKAQLIQVKNNMEQIALEIIHFSDDNGGRMPTDIRSKGGRTLLSWRVAILPFIKEGDLYKEFKLDEPWDEEHNKKLIAKMPKVYAPVRIRAKQGQTFCQVFTGEGALFGPRANPIYPAGLQDGTSCTGLVFEAGEPVIWTKPADLTFDADKPLPKLGGQLDGDFHVGMADGSVMFCEREADEQEVKKLITPNGAEFIDRDKLEK